MVLDIISVENRSIVCLNHGGEGRKGGGVIQDRFGFPLNRIGESRKFIRSGDRNLRISSQERLGNWQQPEQQQAG